MKSKITFALVLISLLLISCRRPLPGDSSKQISAMWENTMTKCGNTTWAPVFGGIAEYKDFAWVATEIPVSDMDRNMNHVEWRVSTSIKPGTPYRVWNPFWKRWDREWSPITSVGPSDLYGNSKPTSVEKKNGALTFNGFKVANFTPQHLNCATLPIER